MTINCIAAVAIHHFGGQAAIPRVLPVSMEASKIDHEQEVHRQFV